MSLHGRPTSCLASVRNIKHGYRRWKLHGEHRANMIGLESGDYFVCMRTPWRAKRFNLTGHLLDGSACHNDALWKFCVKGEHNRAGSLLRFCIRLRILLILPRK
jgi:hypothetical protein